VAGAIIYAIMAKGEVQEWAMETVDDYNPDEEEEGEEGAVCQLLLKIELAINRTVVCYIQGVPINQFNICWIL